MYIFTNHHLIDALILLLPFVWGKRDVRSVVPKVPTGHVSSHESLPKKLYQELRETKPAQIQYLCEGTRTVRVPRSRTCTIKWYLLCSTLGFLGMNKTHKYPLYRAYSLGFPSFRVRWARGTSLPIAWLWRPGNIIWESFWAPFKCQPTRQKK